MSEVTLCELHVQSNFLVVLHYIALSHRHTNAARLRTSQH